MKNQFAAGLLCALVSSAASARSHRGHDLPGHAAAPANRRASNDLLYYGGPVVQNPRVYNIWWGDEAAINSELTASNGMSAFFDGVLDSLFVDAWAQYDTTLLVQAGSHMGMAGTNQSIGRGNYGGAYTLSPVPAGNIMDTQIGTTLEAAVDAGTLPPSDPNTIYAIFFPASVTITGDGTSCQDYGAYHDISVADGLVFLVIPDCQPGFLNFTSIASHELAEATTDPAPTAGSMPDYPQAWNDDMGDEAADLCVGTGALIGTEGGQFGVQGIWDQRGGVCATTAHAANDFSVSIAPHSWSMAPGASASLAVNTALLSGTANGLSLSVSAPAGVTATLASTLLNAGDSTMLTVSSANALRDGQVVVTAVLNSGLTPWIHSAALLLNAAPITNDFSISITPADQSVNVGAAANYQVQTAVATGSAANISLGISGLPPGMVATFTPGVVSAGATSMLALKTFDQPAGSYAFNVVGSGSATHLAEATLELTAVGSDAGPLSDAGTMSDAGTTSDAGTDAGPHTDGGGNTMTSGTSSGCGQTSSNGALLIPLAAMGLMMLARARRESRRQ